jgi:hypothetical protein
VSLAAVSDPSPVTEMVRTGDCAFAAGTRSNTARTQAAADLPGDMSADYPAGSATEPLTAAGIRRPFGANRQ